MVGTSIVQATRCSRRSATAASGFHFSDATIGPPSIAGRYIPKQIAAAEESGTRAPTASPGSRPTASMVDRPA